MPQSKKHEAARHAFFYLLAFLALGFVATAIGQVGFQLINHLIAEPASSYSGQFSQSILRFAISSLIIAGPIYYFTTRKINLELAKKEIAPDSGIRKWLTYLAIFVASAIAIGDLIFVLNSFLEGELTLKFFLKCLTIFIIVGGFGFYYLYDLKRTNFVRDVKIKAFGVVFLLIWAACLIAAFLLIDSPWQARQLRIDRERISDLQNITWAINDYYSQNEVLPTLDDLVADSRLREEDLLDPVTQERYEFTVTDTMNYELCANFNRENQKNDSDYYYNLDYYYYNDASWDHQAGRQCFAVEVYWDDYYSYSDFSVEPIR